MSTENTHYGAFRIGELLKNCKKIFFIGIGGVSVSSLAMLSKQNGFSVAGSDRGRSAITERLENAGIEIFYGHSADNLRDADAVVYTIAIQPDNPEYTEAKRRALPCISRADYLGYIMTFSKRRLGVAGMHGKSTCSAMCASVYLAAELDPTVLIGAKSEQIGGFYRIGGGEHFVFEACEYMDSFLDFNPTTAIILNVELEHVDYFESIEHVRESYGKFAALTGENGKVVYNADDSDTVLSLKDICAEKISFGIKNANADFRAKNIEYSCGYPEFDIVRNGELLCRVQMNVSGEYNVYNALACAAAAYSEGIGADAIKKGLEAFTGTGRRMEYKGKLNGACVYDDYGHHPTEIGATLSGARCLAGERRLICVFQPHTYSRTATLFEDFAAALSIADRVILVPIYSARESDTLGVSSEKLASRIGERATHCDSLEEAARLLAKESDEGCFTVVMGAGNVDKIYEMIKFDAEEK